jgi:uncharacterized protein YdeI (YjbR/CyaY-like superfamily)
MAGIEKKEHTPGKKNPSLPGNSDLPVLSFNTAEAWRQWLEKNHPGLKGVWLRMYKKASGIASINYNEALDEALCFGWIDGQVKQYDSDSYIQKFTPRRARSTWSKRNIAHVERLEQEGRMQPPGLKAVEAAKANGCWARA